MKKIFALALVFILVFFLAACGTKEAVQDAVRDAVGGDSSETPPASNVPDDTPGGNGSGNAGGFVNISGDPLTVSETQGTIEDAIGKSVEGQRIVRKYTDAFFEIVYKPEGCTVIHQIYEFDPATGEVTDSSLWYGGFTDEALFKTAFQSALDSSWEDWVRGWNLSEGYYGMYTLPAIQSNANGEYATWEDAVDQGNYETDQNHILIE